LDDVIMCTIRGRAALVIKEEPTTTRATRVSDAVEESGGGLGVFHVTHRLLVGEHPGVEGGTMDTKEATKFGVGEIPPTNQRTEMACGDVAVGGEGLQVEPLGPGVRRGLQANGSVGRCG
jgi:hypothetical protein